MIDLTSRSISCLCWLVSLEPVTGRPALGEGRPNYAVSHKRTTRTTFMLMDSASTSKQTFRGAGPRPRRGPPGRRYQKRNRPDCSWFRRFASSSAYASSSGSYDPSERHSLRFQVHSLYNRLTVPEPVEEHPETSPARNTTAAQRPNV